MLLAIDIGNSSINIGFFDEADLIGKLKIPAHPKRQDHAYKNKIHDFLSKNHKGTGLGGAIISSVVPDLTEKLCKAVMGMGAKHPIVVSAALDTGLTYGVEKPEEIGSDRIANMVAADELFGSPVLVVDFGTATTITALRDRKFLGGAILPGIELMSASLKKGTAKLPRVDLISGDGQVPLHAMGKNTTMCILSGIIYGTAGAVERLIYEMELGESCRFKVVITGGNSVLMRGVLSREFSLDPDLTLKGLRCIHERNI
jgi:type III pantothenate kinase